MDFTENALVLRNTNYGESDRMVTLLTTGRGKICAAMKGTRKAGAKLNFASQPFCFAEYTFAERAGRYTVISASLHNAFYDLSADVRRYYSAISGMEVCDKILLEGMPANEMLVICVEYLKRLCSGERYALVWFLLKALAFAGYPVTLCENAEKFDFSRGSFTEKEGSPVSKSTSEMIRYASGLSGEPSDDGYRRALRLLRAYFSYQNIELKSLDELIENF